MNKIAVFGTKDGVNRTFLLAALGADGAPMIVVQSGRFLKEVYATPGPWEFTRAVDQVTMTVGTPPGPNDMLFAYRLNTTTLSLQEETVSGVQNGSNTAFAISPMSPSGSVLFFKNGFMLEEVVGVAPTTVQYVVTDTGVSLGLAPVATDKLRCFVSGPATAILGPLPVEGKQDGANTRFFSSYVPPLGTEPLLMVLLDGVLQARVLSNPLAGQYAQVSNQNFLLGVAPGPTTSVLFYLVGTGSVATSPYTFTAGRMARRLGIWLQRNLDQTECEEVVNESYRELVDTYQWSFLQVDGVIATEPIKTDGTVAVTQNSRVVTGTDTLFVAADVGKRFRLSTFSNSYLITNVDVGSQSLEISPAYVDPSASAQQYTILKTIYSLGFDIEYLFSVASRYPMLEIPVAVLDRVDPTRFGTSDVPRHFAYRGRDAQGSLQIEIYPVPTTGTVIRYAGIRREAVLDESQRFRGIETAVLNAAASAGCMIVAAKPTAAKTQGPWLQLAEGYQAKLAVILDRLDSLDWTRSTVPQVQRMRDSSNSMAQDGEYMSQHDIGMLGGWGTD